MKSIPSLNMKNSLCFSTKNIIMILFFLLLVVLLLSNIISTHDRDVIIHKTSYYNFKKVIIDGNGDRRILRGGRSRRGGSPKFRGGAGGRGNCSSSSANGHSLASHRIDYEAIGLLSSLS
ncbi:hypothetical protein CsatA_003012 [Cannabis sativa]